MGSLLRLGSFHVAFLLQAVLPLLVIFATFTTVTRDRESGILRHLVLAGSRLAPVLAGKALAGAALALALLTLLVATEGVLAGWAGAPVEPLRLALFVALHGAYLGLVALLTVVVSARARDGRTALGVLLFAWFAGVVVLPRLTAQLAEHVAPLPTRLAFDRAMKEDRDKGLDGHNPADARSAQLQQAVLAQYGVTRTEDLPLNFDGLLMQADEDYGNQVWDVHFGRYHDTLRQQARVATAAAWFNPYQAVRQSSMATAGTDLFHDLDFLRQTEHYRRRLIAALNDKHAHGGSRTGDWDWQAPASFFASLAPFRFEAPPLRAALAPRAGDLCAIGVWWACALAALGLTARRLEAGRGVLS